MSYDRGTGPLAGPFKAKVIDTEKGPDVDLGRLTEMEFATITRPIPKRTYVSLGFFYDLVRDPDNPNRDNTNSDRINTDAIISYQDQGIVLSITKRKKRKFVKDLRKRRDDERRLENHTRDYLTFSIYRRS